MSMSLRSQMVAGVAALSVSAVAIAPIAHPDVLPSTARVSAVVQLSFWSNPLTAIGGVIADVNTNLFNQGFYPDDIWPESFEGTYLYAPLNLGVIPDLANQFSTGPLVGLANNLSGYAWAGVRSGIVLGGGVASSLFNIPGAAVTAVQQLIGGDPAAAWNTLVTEVIGPLKLGLDGAVAGVGYIADNAIENIGTVFDSFLPFLASGIVDSIVKGAGYMAQSIGATFTAIVNQLGQGNVEGAWNAAVEGLLGRNGTLGQFEKLSFGIGIQDTQGKVVIPSPRSVTTSELQRLGGEKVWGDEGITNPPFDPPVPGPTASVPAAAAAQRPQVEAPVAAALVDIPKELTASADSVGAPAPSSEGSRGGEVLASSAPSATSETAGASDAAPKPSRRAPHRGGNAG